MSSISSLWAAIPAAGIGARLGAGVPQQYLTVRGKCILAHVLKQFCEHPDIDGVVVALAAGDTRWQSLEFASHAKVQTTTGGTDRCHSVLNCLRRLRGRARPEDWVLVHDAARPCIRREDIDGLVGAVRDHSVGGILALPARDTMKRANEAGAIAATVEREGLWHAQTPQMFRIGALEAALNSAIEQGQIVTDESQAMELQGFRPLLVPGSRRNIKITHGDDLVLAELFLSLPEGPQ